MGSPIRIEIVSELAAERPEVWRSASTMAGINFELRPFVRMTSPAEHQQFSTAPVPGQVVFKSWLLAFGLLPIDRHSLALDQLEEGHGFVEGSSSWLQRRWRHERILDDTVSGNCCITDRLVIEPRLAFTTSMVAAVVRRLFEHRHRRLAKRFGAG